MHIVGLWYLSGVLLLISLYEQLSTSYSMRECHPHQPSQDKEEYTAGVAVSPLRHKAKDKTFPLLRHNIHEDLIKSKHYHCASQGKDKRNNPLILLLVNPFFVNYNHNDNPADHARYYQECMRCSSAVDVSLPCLCKIFLILAVVAMLTF